MSSWPWQSNDPYLAKEEMKMRANRYHIPFLKRVLSFLLAIIWILCEAVPAAWAARTSSRLAATGDSIPTLGVVQQWSLSEPAPGFQDQFGYSVAIDGNTAVIGARNADLEMGTGLIQDAGAAYVYIYNGKTWLLQARLVAKNASAGDTFGVSVAISGDRILVGATGVDLTDPGEKGGELENAGAAYIFTRSGSVWSQQAQLTAADPAEEDSFGSSVALERGTAVVAAETKSLPPLINLGAVYVFYNIAGKTWKEQAKLLPSDPYLGDYFGSSVAIEGDRIAVGAIQTPPLGQSGPGKAFVFKRSGTKWSLETRLKAEGGRSGDSFGSAIALYGSTLVIGAPYADPEQGGGRVTSAGVAYVFNRSGSTWNESARLAASDAGVFNHFGGSLSIDRNLIVVGAQGATQAGNSRSGAVYLFKKIQNTWTSQTRAVTDPTQQDDLFGKSVALSGDWFVVGASGRNPEAVTGAGQAYLNKLGTVQLPDTGFAPGVRTLLPAQPTDLVYQGYSGMLLEIPALQTSLAVVGVPKSGNGWDVRWLGKQAGYLEGTAFPTWQGNTGLAAHSILEDGSPGPFANLGLLHWGDEVILHAWGQRYIYEVRQNSLTSPAQLTALKHEDLDWITLITCQGYDEEAGAYRWRRVVRAVLVAVQPDM
jgi:LPXTG-site transpeptidase (sortase) family protein